MKTESILEESMQNLNQKSLYLKEREEIIEAMSRKIQSLQSTQDAMKVRFTSTFGGLIQTLLIFLVCYVICTTNNLPFLYALEPLRRLFISNPVSKGLWLISPTLLCFSISLALQLLLIIKFFFFFFLVSWKIPLFSSKLAFSPDLVSSIESVLMSRKIYIYRLLWVCN